MNRETLLKKIDTANERLKQLKSQEESAKKKTLKSIRKRRNDNIKELINLLTPETSFADSLEIWKGVKQ